MAKPYGISGTPWHVEIIHNNNPDDPRRHRSRCVFYTSNTKQCQKLSSCCYGARYCKYYLEKTADTYVDESIEEKPETPAKELPILTANKPLPLKKKETETVWKKPAARNKSAGEIHIGSLVCIGTSEYFIWDIKHDEDLKVTYYCRRITEEPEPGDLWLYEKKYLSAAITQMDSLKDRTIKQIPPDILKQVLERRFSSETGKSK